MFILEYQATKKKWKVIGRNDRTVEDAQRTGDKWWAHNCRIKNNQGKVVSIKSL